MVTGYREVSTGHLHLAKGTEAPRQRGWGLASWFWESPDVVPVKASCSQMPVHVTVHGLWGEIARLPLLSGPLLPNCLSALTFALPYPLATPQPAHVQASRP